MAATREPDPQQTTDHAPAAPAPTTDGSLAHSTQLPGRTAESPPRPIPTVPGYELLHVLGRGGMGVVYAARHTALKRTVALKMVLAGGHAAPHQLVRFRIEAEAVARLQHPNIVQIHEVGEADSHPYCALEFVDGGTLAAKLAAAPLPPLAAAELVEALARAMHVAHERSVVHRDLKPANVLLTADGTPKITDFGLARQLDSDADSRETQAGTVMGTPSYMAPEQASGLAHEAGPLVDVYALGAILYECLCGRPPFQGRSVVETLDMVRTQEPVPPSRIRANVPRDLETICLKALAKAPARRYASAGELADDLRRVRNDEPILARRIGAGERLWRRVRRNPALVGLSAAVFALGIAVAVVLANRPQPQVQVEAPPVAAPSPAPLPQPVAVAPTDTSTEDLLAAIAELDRTDPDWRLEQIDAKRPTYPDEENGAKPIIDFRKQFAATTGRPKSEGSWAPQELADRLFDLRQVSPRSPLGDVETLRSELQRMAPFLTTVRKLADLPRGRFPTVVRRDAVSTLLPDHAAGYHIANLLWCDALVCIADGNRRGAVTAVRGLLHLGWVYTDEPMQVVQLMRTAHFRSAIRALERLTAQIECDDDELTGLQAALAEPEVPVIVTIARGERGVHHYFLSSLSAGDRPDSWTLKAMGLDEPGSIPDVKELRRLHLWLLRYDTELVANARRPLEKQPPLMARLDEAIATAPPSCAKLVTILVLDPFDDGKAGPKPSYATVAMNHATRHAAEVRTARAALAVERYRVANGEWPRDLAATVPEFLANVPTDPYDGQSLRFRRTPDGVAIYSVGPDRTDDRGTIVRTMNSPSTGDIGFQLWNPDHRTPNP